MGVRKNKKSSFQKEFFYVSALLSEPIAVKFPWGEEVVSPPKQLNISDLIYQRTYSCMDNFPCRKCCIGLWSLFLEGFTLPDIQEAVTPHSEKETLTVNGKDFTYLCVDHNGEHCPLSSMETGCTVHIGNPITCMFPLVHFRQYRKENINILIAHFGRNWKMGCPVTFRPYNSREEFEERVIPRFVRLIEYMEFLGVPHKGADILAELRIGRDKFIDNEHTGFGIK